MYHFIDDDFEDEGFDSDGLPKDPKALEVLTEVTRIECQGCLDPVSDYAMLNLFLLDHDEMMRAITKKIVLMERDGRNDYAARLRRRKTEFLEYYELLMLSERFRN